MRRRSQSPRGTSLRSTLLSSTAKTDVEVTGVASAPLDYGGGARLDLAFLRELRGLVSLATIGGSLGVRVPWPAVVWLRSLPLGVRAASRLRASD